MKRTELNQRHSHRIERNKASPIKAKRDSREKTRAGPRGSRARSESR
jgi:hypothetical protein